MAAAWGGDACVALVPFSRCIGPATMGDASVPTLPPSHPRPYETTPLPSSFHKNLPVKAGVVWMGSGDACVALTGGGMNTQDRDEGDAQHKASPPSPYRCEGASLCKVL